MKYTLLQKIVTEYAYELKECAAYNGERSDGGCQNLLSKFNNYTNNLIIKFDLRPSEFNKLNEIEIGEPNEFINIIEKYKINLAKNIKL